MMQQAMTTSAIEMPSMTRIKIKRACEAGIHDHEGPGGQEPESGPRDRPGESVNRAGAVEAAGEDDEGVGDEAHGDRGDDLDKGGSAARDTGQDGSRDHHPGRGGLDAHRLGDRPVEPETPAAKSFRFARTGVSRRGGAYFREPQWDSHGGLRYACASGEAGLDSGV
jgi:hypothetical protein